MSAQLPPCRGHDAGSIQHYVTACRACAVVRSRQGHLQEAAELEEAAGAQTRQPNTPAGADASRR